jgi:tetratricopeptide (TPR) repeat protein
VCLRTWDHLSDKEKEENPKLYPLACNHSGVAYHCLGEFPKSLKWFQRVKEIYEDIFPEGHFERGNTYANLGNINLSLGRPKDALEFHLKAKDSFTIGHNLDSTLIKRALPNISWGKCYIDLGDLAQGREVVNMALEQTTKLGYIFSQAQ